MHLPPSLCSIFAFENVSNSRGYEDSGSRVKRGCLSGVWLTKKHAGIADDTTLVAGYFGAGVVGDPLAFLQRSQLAKCL